MKATVRVSEHADLQKLARNMVLQAWRDVRKKRQPVKQLDALFWLASDDARVWLAVWGFDLADPFKALASGKADELLRRFKL